MSKFTAKIIVLLFSALVLLFIVAPLLGMYLKPGNLAFTIKDQQVLDSIKFTLLASAVATIFFGFFALPFAYFLARKDFILKPLVLAIIDLPLVIPHASAGIALLSVVNRDTAVGKFASSIGLDIVSAPAGTIIAMAFVSLPFFINSARDGFANVPVRLEKVAQSMGASPFKVFFSVSMPLAKRNIISGTVMMFARGMSEFGAVVIIAYHPMIAPVLIWDRFNAFGLEYAKPVAIIFLTISVIIFSLFRLLSKNAK